LAALVFAGHRYTAFRNDLESTFGFNDLLWLAWLIPTIVAGFLFGLATSTPFVRGRYVRRRLALAAVALAPIVQFWWVFGFQHERFSDIDGWLYRVPLLMDRADQTVLAALVGVALASGFQSDPTVRAQGVTRS
jgi:hypothetical protein